MQLIITKPKVTLENNQAKYFIFEKNASDIIGKIISIKFDGQITCQNCSSFTKKSYSNGYCFLCSRKLAACDLCIMRPHTCHYHLGTCREPDWGQSFCFQEHFVYLAFTSHFKVGLTRNGQIPTRFINQGAIKASPIAKVKNRLNAGKLEFFLTQYISDKTNWKSMLKSDNQVSAAAFNEKFIEIQEKCIQFSECTKEILPMSIYDISYPILDNNYVIKSINLVKTPQFKSALAGIKGQYLIFKDGVLNLGKHTGFNINLDIL